MFNSKLPILFLFTACFSSTSGVVVPTLKRSIEKTGFHRELTTTLTVSLELLPDLQKNSRLKCQVMFAELIPSGAYVDQYQLASLQPFGGPDFLLTDIVDLEQAEFMSQEFTVYIFSNISIHENVWRSSYTLPVHMRYHAVSTQDFASVTFTNPEVAINCRDKTNGLNHQVYSGVSLKEKKYPCDSSSSLLCDWTIIQYDASTEKLDVMVPVGKTDHYFIVTLGTIITTLAACLALGYKVAFSGTKTKIS